MKTIILDSGPVITLALNNLLWLLETVKKKYNMNFYITSGVKSELIDHPLNTKKFKFEALQVLNLIENGTIKVISNKEIKEKTDYLLELANTSFKAKGRFLKLAHYAEISAVASFFFLKADAVMIDERTTRYLLETPDRLRNILRHKLHTKAELNKKSMNLLKKHTKGIKFIRSAEFVTVSFEKGLLDEYLPNKADSKQILLDALLWGVKLNGCAISNKDLELMYKLSLKKLK